MLLTGDKVKMTGTRTGTRTGTSVAPIETALQEMVNEALR